MTQTNPETAEVATETTAHTTAEGGEHGGSKFPPLDTKTFPSQIFWLAVFFGLLYLLLSKMVLPRLAKILANRANQIDGDLAKAKALQEQTAAALAAYEKSLSDAKGNANAIAQETRNSLQASSDAERAKLDAALAAKIATAETKIAASRGKALAEVHGMATESAMAIVEQLTGAKVTKAAAIKALGGKA
jgi:F-type H+-transporting ATPase subunit b